jgi:hypothetical protein
MNLINPRLLGVFSILIVLIYSCGPAPKRVGLRQVESTIPGSINSKEKSYQFTFPLVVW